MKSIVSHIRQSLALKLSITILLIAMPIFIVVLGFLFHQSREEVRHEAVSRAGSVLTTTSHRIRRYLNTVETANHANAWIVTENFDPDNLLDFARRIVMLNANVGGCSISAEPSMFPQCGRYFSVYAVRQGDSISAVREPDYEYFDMDWYEKAARSGKPCWVDPFMDNAEGWLSARDVIASYSNPLFDKEGRLIGILSTDVRFSSLAAEVSKVKPYPNAYLMMLGENGHYFIHPDTARLLHETIFDRFDVRSHTDLVALGHEMVTGKQGAMGVTIDGQSCLVCYQPVPGTKWSIALVCPGSDIFRDYNYLTFVIMPLILIGLLLILILSRHIVNRAVSPLNQLVRQSQELAAGHYGEKIPSSSRRDVVGRLQNGFARMQESIEAHVRSIRQVNQETEQRNAELQTAKLMAEESSRQKTAFIQNMTHQVRTPLNIIVGFAQVLRDNISELPEDEVTTIIGMMGHNTHVLSRMMLMLYDSSETGKTEEEENMTLEDVSCNEVVRESICFAQKYFPELKIHFLTSLPDSFCILSNHLYLMRSIRELLYNAAKYSDGEQWLRIDKTDTTVRFVFEDRGPGISEDYREQMFTFFTKVNDLSEGLGLGLPLTKRHVNILGGDLIFDADYREGCRFVIELPL